MKAWILAFALLAGCASQSQVGPYVKSVSRAGDSLMIIRCMIVLVHEDLQEGTCERQYVPLGAVPVQPPAEQPPGQLK